MATYLQKLNDVQCKAVTSTAKHLQILAGPGSGKTRVLTTRVAHLILQQKIKPSCLLVATFTRKAAREMKDRLSSSTLLGPDLSNELNMGTFHSICATYLRHNYHQVGIKSDFRIIEPEETKKVLEKLIPGLIPNAIEDYGVKSIQSVVGLFQAKISRAKNEGFKADAFEEENEGSDDQGIRDLVRVFNAYQQRLRVEHLVDFDDLLLLGRDLFRTVPMATSNIKHILVDEFQDTNKVQYDIVYYIARGSKHITIVGDPDQSIYGFRAACSTNFRKMISDFPDTEIVNLEQNYRSTSSILESAFYIIDQEPDRIKKGLFTDNCKGERMSLLQCIDDVAEAHAISEEIARVKKFSKGVINYKDIAVLVRAHYLTRNIEDALVQSGIPYMIVGGLRFYDRMEVKDILSYVHFIYNNNDTMAFERIINTPRRGVGDVTRDKICSLSRVTDQTVLDVVEELCNQTAKKKSPRLADYTLPAKVKTNVKKFITLVKDARDMIERKASVKSMLLYIIDYIDYHGYLKRYYPDHEIRWENVGELISAGAKYDKNRDEDGKSVEQQDQDEGSTSQKKTRRRKQKHEQATEDNVIGDIGAFVNDTTLDPNRDDSEQPEDDKVQIMTMHAAKGLEWPIVFVAAAETDIIPHPRAEDINEERRLMYVAMTRAECFLYVTYCQKREVWGKRRKAFLTPFLSAVPEQYHQRRTPPWNAVTRQWVLNFTSLPSPTDLTATTEGEKKEEQADDDTTEDDHPGNEFPDLDEELMNEKSKRRMTDRYDMFDEYDKYEK